jgi:hypothetical protein
MFSCLKAIVNITTFWVYLCLDGGKKKKKTFGGGATGGYELSTSSPPREQPLQD